MVVCHLTLLQYFLSQQDQNHVSWHHDAASEDTSLDMETVKEGRGSSWSDLTARVSPEDILESLVKIDQDYLSLSSSVAYTPTPSVPAGPTPQGKPNLTDYISDLD